MESGTFRKGLAKYLSSATNDSKILGGTNLIHACRAACSRVNPKEWIMPLISEFNLDQVAARGAPRPAGFEDSGRAWTPTINPFQD